MKLENARDKNIVVQNCLFRHYDTLFNYNHIKKAFPPIYKIHKLDLAKLEEERLEKIREQEHLAAQQRRMEILMILVTAGAHDVFEGHFA